jgi:hypothetical protein
MKSHSLSHNRDEARQDMQIPVTGTSMSLGGGASVTGASDAIKVDIW